MKVFHAAVNHVSETSSNVLARIKELGNNSPSIRLPKKLFGEATPCQREGFVIEMEGLAQVGQYLIPTGSCKVLSREVGEAIPFDVAEGCEAGNGEV